MPQTYTLTEVADLLTVDPKSLRRWIEIEQYDLSNQTTPYDKRVKFLTEDQVARLAKAHDRLWPPAPKASQPDEPQGTPGAVKLLQERVTAIEIQTDQIAEQGRSLADVLLRVQSLERAASVATEQLTRLTLLANDQAAQIAALSEQLATRSRPARQRAQQPGDDQDISELEPGLVGAADFAEAHNINVGTAKSAWQSGRIPTRRGKWHSSGRNPITVALDSEGRARFYELYHQHADFQPCADCPHEENTGV